MNDYDRVATDMSRQLTIAYSTSFSLASRLFAKEIRPDIYNIYGLVRIADEIVDTYKGDDAHTLLHDLEAETYDAIKRRYSTNLIVHAFQLTANRVGIPEDYIKAFFKSMRADLSPVHFDKAAYEEYIYGSAEVVGLMCLKVFVAGSDKLFNRLAPGARRLGAAYQKVNFLRDLAYDHTELGRSYFPALKSDSFSETEKKRIIKEIDDDFKAARPSIDALPSNSQRAVLVSYRYYQELLLRLEQAPASRIAAGRIRLPDSRKLVILTAHVLRLPARPKRTDRRQQRH